MHEYSNTDGTSTLDTLILSCVGPVERMAYAYCGDCSNHEDFVSIGMLKVCEWAARAQANATDPLAYLCTAAQRAMLDECQRLRRLKVVSLDAPLTGDGSLCLHDVVPDRSSVPAPVAPDSSKRRRALRSALARLSAQQRAAVLHRAGLPGYGTHSTEETARALHTSTVKAAQMAAYHGRRNLAHDARLREVIGLEVAQ